MKLRRILILIALVTIGSFTYSFAEPRVGDQKTLPWCTVYAVCNGVEAQMERSGLATPENGFSYEWLWGMMSDEYDVPTVESALAIAYEYGLCPTDSYNKREAKENLAEAQEYKITSYAAISAENVETAVSSGAIVILATIYQDENWSNGIITFDSEFSDGLHASYLIAKRPEKKGDNGVVFYEGINSWGTRWGFFGHYYMQKEYAQYFSTERFTVEP